MSWEIITALGGPVVPVFKKERHTERERDEDGDYEEKDGEGSVRISVKKERG